MNSEEERFMKLLKWPATLNREQTAWVLGFQCHEIAELMRTGLLRPLGEPAANGGKFFATVEIERLGKDRSWLGRARKVIQKHWRQKNGPKESLEEDTIHVPTDPRQRTPPQSIHPSPTTPLRGAPECFQDGARRKRNQLV